MSNKFEPDPIKGPLGQVEELPLPAADPIVIQRITDRVFEKWRGQQAQIKRKNRFAAVLGTSMRLRVLVPTALAAGTILVIGISILLVSTKKAEAQSKYFKSTVGLNHAQIRNLFPNFAALRDAPDELLDGSIAVPGEIKDGEWPSFKGFDVLNDSKLYDMTWWRPLDARQIESGRNSPVEFTRTLLLRRNRNVPRVNELTFKFSTTGFAVDPVKIKPTDRVIAVPEKELSYTNGGKLEKVYFLITDVGDKPDKDPFTLVIHAIYWNGFNHGSIEDASTALPTTGDGCEADLGVLFPPHDYFAKKWALYKTPLVKGKPADKTAANCFADGHVPELEPGILYWPIAEPQPSSRYTLEWTWATVGDKK